MLLLSHINDHLFSNYFFFIKLFFSLFLIFFFFFKKLLVSLLVHTYYYNLHFFQLFPSLFASLSPHYSLLYRNTSLVIFSYLYFDFSSLHFILYKFDIVSPIQSIIFPHKNCEYSLSFFTFFWYIFVLSYKSN